MVETELLKSQISDLHNALSRLEEALVTEESELIRDATIKRFEFSFELAWKLMKSANLKLGKECSSPNDCIRKSAQTELLDNPEKWLKYLDLRNLATHTYKEEIAIEVYGQIGGFLKDAKILLETIRQKSLAS